MDAASTKAETFLQQLTAIPEQIKRLALMAGWFNSSNMSDVFREKSWDLLTAIIDLIATGLVYFSHRILRRSST